MALNNLDMEQNVTHSVVFEGQKRTQLAKQRFVYSYKEHSRLQVARACREAGVSRVTYYRWLENDQDFKRECEIAEMMFHDEVKGRLMMKIQKGSIRAIIAYLKMYHPDFR